MDSDDSDNADDIHLALQHGASTGTTNCRSGARSTLYEGGTGSGRIGNASGGSRNEIQDSFFFQFLDLKSDNSGSEMNYEKQESFAAHSDGSD
ncbi:unnamed protein product [Caenorhabditis nigoni]